MALPLLLAGLGLGATKSIFDQMREGRQRKLAAETERYSPWTGMKSRAPQEADWFGNLLQGGLVGAQLGQGNPLTGGGAPGATGDVYSRLASRPGILGVDTSLSQFRY